MPSIPWSETSRFEPEPMKKIFISGVVLTVIVLISYILIADDGGDFTLPAQRTQGVQCAGCFDIWDGKGQFVDMIWEASP